ncbi:thioredoxin-like fold domain-containing protein MRL7L, chloroplastic isoform X2 [Macadamia integrifolia]|uniref:thioredoxin-like fold domain-containing protein MRL7L, chloroplastic isoform X2 n=1 Tax=Macadamia integrifolia TaxID=60698 RepID=UPI001C4EE6CC|nr:thioredoxin-like fold domain-containing protein MRL7L, chloroplastic isoform X2 [Macadamia integrifolia]
MALQSSLRLQHFLTAPKQNTISCFASAFSGGILLSKATQRSCSSVSSSKFNNSAIPSPKFPKLSLEGNCRRRTRLRASKVEEEVGSDGGRKDKESKIGGEDDEDGPTLMDEGERREWRRKIREVIDKNPDVEEEEDPEERTKKMEKLLADYPLVVDEEEPDWPDDADGWGFNFGQFFNKITIKNVKKDDDENYDSDKELVWQDDNYIRPIKDITTMEWEETVFKDISPLIILVHNRYKRPRENEKVRDELEKAVHVFWNSRLPSPRCVAVDAVVELDLVSALKVSDFPEIIFTKAGKILYREKANRTADDLSRIMAFFYYGAAKPPCLSNDGDSQEVIPSLARNKKEC